MGAKLDTEQTASEKQDYEKGFTPPVDLYLISEKSIWKNQFWRTGFLVYFEFDFYCLYGLKKSISKLIFAG